MGAGIAEGAQLLRGNGGRWRRRDCREFSQPARGHVGIEQLVKGAQDAAFGLPAQAEQNEIVAREDGVTIAAPPCPS